MLFPQLVIAHGYVSDPPSRALMCKEGKNTNCGEDVIYDTHSLEGNDGFPAANKGPRDSHLASADRGRFVKLDEQTVDRWKLTDIKPGKKTFKWVFTASHKTADFKYYLTKPDWNPNMPLSRAQFDETPFCTIPGNGQTASDIPDHECTIPSDRTGHHVIYAVWDVSDTASSFLNAIDVNILKDGGEPTPPPVWTDVGDILPLDDLKIGDQVLLHSFNESGEIPGREIGITISSKEDGHREQWPMVMAEKINATAGGTLRAGMMRENGEIVVSSGKNDIFVKKGSEVVRTEIEVKKKQDPNPPEDFEVTNNSEFPIKENGTAEVKFDVQTTPPRNTEIELKIYDKDQKLVDHQAAIRINPQSTPVKRTLQKAEAGDYTAVFIEAPKNGALIQKTTTFKLKGEGAVIPQWRYKTEYWENDKVQHKGAIYRARWYSVRQEPGLKSTTGPEGSGKVWHCLENCTQSSKK